MRAWWCVALRYSRHNITYHMIFKYLSVFICRRRDVPACGTRMIGKLPTAQRFVRTLRNLSMTRPTGLGAPGLVDGRCRLRPWATAVIIPASSSAFIGSGTDAALKDRKSVV